MSPREAKLRAEGGGFALDTSGGVAVADGASGMSGRIYRWSDLEPFEQGYIEALFAAQDLLIFGTNVDADTGIRSYRRAGFSDLAPETLARIIADCAAYQTAMKPYAEPRLMGAQFWIVRSRGGWKIFPPLTLYLGDDGKVRFHDSLEG